MPCRICAGVRPRSACCHLLQRGCRGDAGEIVEDGTGGLRLGGVEQPGHALDHVGDADFAQGVQDGAGTVLDAAQQDGAVGPGQAPGLAVLGERHAAHFLNLAGDPAGFMGRAFELEAEQVAMLEGLVASTLHAFLQPPVVAFHHLPSGFHHAFAAAEVLGQRNPRDAGIAVGKADDVGDVAAVPLVDGLVVVADHAQLGAEVVKQADQGFLQRIHVLVFIHDQVFHPLGHLLPQAGIGHQRPDRLGQDHAVVEVPVLVQQRAVLGQGLAHRVIAQGGLVDLRLAHEGEDLHVQLRILPTLQTFPVVGGEVAQAALDAVTVDEQALLHFAQDRILEEAEEIGLEQVQAETVDGADEHLGQADIPPQLLTAQAVDAVLEFAGGLLGEGEGHDVRRGDAFDGLGAQDVDDALGQHLGLARARAGDHLEVAVQVADGLLLSFRILHSRLAPYACLGNTPSRAKLYARSPATMM